MYHSMERAPVLALERAPFWQNLWSGLQTLERAPPGERSTAPLLHCSALWSAPDRERTPCARAWSALHCPLRSLRLRLRMERAPCSTSEAPSMAGARSMTYPLRVAHGRASRHLVTMYASTAEPSLAIQGARLPTA